MCYIHRTYIIPKFDKEKHLFYRETPTTNSPYCTHYVVFEGVYTLEINFL
jgi:hypothetical protein